MSPMRYVPDFHVDGHDDDCAAHHLEPCDCASGIVRTVRLAFQRDLNRIIGSPRQAARRALTGDPK